MIGALTQYVSASFVSTITMIPSVFKNMCITSFLCIRLILARPLKISQLGFRVCHIIVIQFKLFLTGAAVIDASPHKALFMDNIATLITGFILGFTAKSRLITTGFTIKVLFSISSP